ncbi:MAG: FAD-dependent oxidoreductase, partial [Actinomycetota bacterium]
MVGVDSSKTDVVIIGGGLAGLSAGVHLAEAGISVVILEKGTETRYPCNTRYSGGGFHLAFRNMRTPADELYEHLKSTYHADTDLAQLRALADDAASTMDWLTAHGANFGVGGPAEFQSNMLQPFSLRETGLAGHWSGKGADHLVDELGERLVKAGGTLLRGHRADHLLLEHGAVVGAEVATGDHTTKTIQARAVVLADGGFQGNLDLLRQYVCSHPERLLQRGPATGQGDGLRMAVDAGASVVGLDRFYGHVQVREAMHSTRFWPYPLLDIVASAGILVDSSGRRFVDEGLGGIACANAIGKLDDPLSGVLIMDSDMWSGPGTQFVLPPNPALLDPEVTLFSADTIADLAR